MALLKADSVVVRMLMPRADSPEWRGTVDYYEKHILGPESEVWFKIVYTSGWWDWYLALILLGLARLV